MLETNPEMSQRVLSIELGISLGAVNFCINSLIEKGHIKTRSFRTSKRKRQYAYFLTPKGVAEKVSMTGRFLQRKLEEYDALKAEIASLQSEMDVGAEIAPQPRTQSRKTR